MAGAQTIHPVTPRPVRSDRLDCVVPKGHSLSSVRTLRPGCMPHTPRPQHVCQPFGRLVVSAHTAWMSADGEFRFGDETTVRDFAPLPGSSTKRGQLREGVSSGSRPR
jgi:hypothetical protein